MSASIRKIAKLAGVSVATVSRVINHQAGVKPETKALVRKYIEQFNYSPKMVKKTDSPNICALIPWRTSTDSDWYLGQLLQGLGNYAFSNRLNFGMFPFNVEMSGRVDIIQELKRNNIDGVVVLNATSESSYVMQLHQHKIPYMLVNEDMHKAANCVVADSFTGTRKMTEYLIEQGHTEILFIQGSTAISDARERTAGFIATMQGAGIPNSQEHIYPHSGYGPSMYERGRSIMTQLLNQNKKYTAILANCDSIALGVLKACRENNIDVPGTISIAGYDESLFGRYSFPTFTTIRQPLKKMSELAMREVHNFINNGVPDSPVIHRMPVEIIINDSTGPAPR
jgi:DNA-binding LacI/PurR family transcriptional regulator